MSVNFPIVQADTSFLDVLHAISNGMLGVVVVNFADEHYGLITDGDIRRTIEEQGSNVFSITAYNMMTRAPVSVENGTSMHNALELMEHHSVSCLLVKRDRKVVGILKNNLSDYRRAGVIPLRICFSISPSFTGFLSYNTRRTLGTKSADWKHK